MAGEPPLAESVVEAAVTAAAEVAAVVLVAVDDGTESDDALGFAWNVAVEE